MKKKARVSVVFLMAVCMFLSVFFTNTDNVYAASANGRDIVETARQYIGKVPYVWGGNYIDGANPGADCSGFICRIYEKFGYNFWSNRTKLRNCGTNIGTDLSQARLGDIIWFEGHVAIYSGINTKGQHMIVHETGGVYQNVVETPASKVAAELKGIIRIPGVYNDGEPIPEVIGKISYNNVYVKSLSDTTATVRAEVSSDGTLYKEAGLYWGTTADTTEKVSFDTSRQSILTFIEVIFDGSEGPVLSKGTTYYYRFYAIRHDGTVDADETLRSFTTTGDSEAPVISDIKISQIDYDGFTLECTVTDNVGIERVCFPTWTEVNGQDDLADDWYNTTTATEISGNTYWFRVNRMDYGLRRGWYMTHIYAYDYSGNYSIAEKRVILPTPVEEIQLSDTLLNMKKGDTKKVTATILPSEAANTMLEWQSDNPNVVTVDENGNVTAVGVGSTIVNVSAVAFIGTEIKSTYFIVIVTDDIKITTQPASVNVTEGANATFKVAATGSDLTYQWQFKNASATYWTDSTMTGAKTNSITVKATTARNGYQYRCVVKDGSGNKVTSNAAKLTVNKGAQITEQPSSATVTEGGNATFKVTASGSNLTYQWQFKKAGTTYWTNSTMTGSKTNSITVQGTTARNGYQYRCVVKDANGNKVTSNAATLTVKQVQGVKITGQPTSQVVLEGANATFKVTATGSNLTYQWQFKKAGTTYWSDSTMAGSKTNSITVQGTTARNGYQYRCVVKDGNGNKVTSNAATLTVVQGQGVKITGQPASQTVTAGSSATFKVTASGSGLTYQWQFKSTANNYWADSTMAGSKTNSITVQGTTARNGYQYRCVVKDANGNKVTSNAAKLTVQ